MNLNKIKSTVGKARASFKLGFTLIELIVVIGIFSLIMAVALWNQKELSNNILITNLAYEIALAVRETQAYGIGVRTSPTSSPTSTDFQKPFGLHVDLTNGNEKQWVLFQDQNNDSIYQAGETFAIYKFQNQNGNRITALCLNHPITTPCIRSASLGSSFVKLDILFRRPNPEAYFQGGKGLGAGAELGFPGPAYIVVNT